MRTKSFAKQLGSVRVELESDSGAVDSVAVGSIAVGSIAVDSIATLLPQQKLSSLTERRRAQMLRRKTHLMEGRGKGRGSECRTERHAAAR